MPRQTLVRDPTKERAEMFAANIEKYMRIRRKTNLDIANAIGVTEQVMYKRRQKPKMFSFSEVIQIMDYLKFSPADRAEVVGVEIKLCELT